jgi:outer membrane protein OmpA-like peptidoglycan-associated protein
MRAIPTIIALVAALDAPLSALVPAMPTPTAAIGAQTPAPPKLTLVKSMRVDWAWRGDSTEGDYTPYMFVTGVDPASVSITGYSTKGKAGGGKEDVVIDTRMLRSAMADGRIYRQIWITTDPMVMQGTTSMMLSAAVMRDFATKGTAPLTIVDGTNLAGRNLAPLVSLMRALTSDSTATGTPYSGTMTRVEPGTLPFAVLVNDRRVTVPSIHIRGVLSHVGEQYSSDMQVLADPAFPLVLSHTVPPNANGGRGGGGRVVSITYPDTNAAKQLENDLAAKRPVEIYDIYFDYNSAAIKPASDSMLRELGTIMQRHPDWTLRVTGHTDSIGGSGAGNRILSEHRAAAVKDALSSRYGVAATRLTTGGAGDSAPLETNSTLEGRARNRRVELIRE